MKRYKTIPVPPQNSLNCWSDGSDAAY